MGDRCNVSLTVRARDRAQVVEVYGSEPYDEQFHNGAVCMEFDEVNYGGDDENNELAERGVPFYGTHSSGGEYGPYAFCSRARTKTLEQTPLSELDESYVTVGPTGNIDEEQLAKVRFFLWAEAEARAIVDDCGDLRPAKTISRDARRLRARKQEQ